MNGFYDWLESLGTSSFSAPWVFAAFGGLGLFLFGITFMGEGLKSAAGNKLRDVINKFTKTPIRGILTGMIITVLIQSSSGSTAIAIGLVAAGLMTFPQAIGIIFGANIGTTITAFLIGMKLSNWALAIVAIAGLGYMFVKSPKKKAIFTAILGFGIMFLGMKFMSSGFKQFATEPWFRDLLVKTGDIPVLGFLMSTALTALVQSSSASLGIIQGLAADGQIPLRGMIAMTFGANLGTTITAVIACIGASRAAKRTSTVHVLFNLIGAAVGLALLVPYAAFLEKLFEWTNIDTNFEMQIAYAHGIFNIVFVLAFMWFIPWFAKFAYFVFKEDEKEKASKTNINLNYDLIFTAPSLALEEGKIAVQEMAKLAQTELEFTHSYLNTWDKENLNRAQELEIALDTAFGNVQKFLRELAKAELQDSQLAEYQALILASKDIERVGDYSENLNQEFTGFIADKVRMSDEAWEDLKVLFKKVLSMMKDLQELLVVYDEKVAKRIQRKERELDKLEITARENHIERLRAGTCTVADRVNYQKIIGNIERIGDHINNVGRFFRSKN